MTWTVGGFYESHPYPPPVDDVDAYARTWNDGRRRVDSHLFWPHEPYRDDRTILIAGCGTTQAAHYAVRWPHARVTGIDVSATSLAFSEDLKRKHALENLELRQLAVENARDLGRTFDHVVCTGVLHHLADPDAGLRALRDVLAPGGAMHVMVYAPYGRAGIYMLQEYCRRLGIGWGDAEIDDLAATLRALPPDHPLAPLLKNAPDFATRGGVADALLHPCDRAYSVPELMGFFSSNGLAFGRWIRQAAYLPRCGAIAATPQAPLLATLPPASQYAAMELFRGTMARHSAIVYASDTAAGAATPDFEGDAWLDYVPMRLPETVTVRERVPALAAAVLINRNHTHTDLYLPIDVQQERLLAAVDGRRTVQDIFRARSNREFAHDFFRSLWRWDQIIFDTSNARVTLSRAPAGA